MNNELKAIIEISMDGYPVKYEFNKESNMLEVDRFMNVSMRYPCNYGYIPGTLGGDGDPLDILVVSQFPVMPGCSMKVRVVGLLNMEDESGLDEKIIAVPTAKLDPLFASVNEARDLPQIQLDRIKHFFERYKDLEPGKWVKIIGWGSAKEAINLVEKYATE